MEEERTSVLAALLWRAGLRVGLGIGTHALRIYYAVFGLSNEIREDIVLLPRSTREQNGHSDFSTL